MFIGSWLLKMFKRKATSGASGKNKFLGAKVQKKKKVEVPESDEEVDYFKDDGNTGEVVDFSDDGEELTLPTQKKQYALHWDLVFFVFISHLRLFDDSDEEEVQPKKKRYAHHLIYILSQNCISHILISASNGAVKPKAAGNKLFSDNNKSWLKAQGQVMH